MTRNSILSFFIFILLISCGSADTSVAQVDSKSSVPKKSVGNSCLAKNAMEPNNLISKQEIAKIANVDPSILELKPITERFKKSKYYTKSEMRFSTYEMPSDRTMEIKVGSNTMQVPTDNKIMVGGMMLLDKQDRKIEISYGDWFANRYRVLTDEEQASFESQVDKEFEKSEELKNQSEETKKIAKSFTNIGKAFQYESVADIGDRSTMESMGKFKEVSLHVLHQNITFTVKVDVSDDKEVNKDIAKKIAKSILDSCK